MKVKQWLRRRWQGAAWLAGALVVAGLAIAVSGIIPIKGSAGHWPITRWFLDFSKVRSVRTQSAFIDAPPLDDPRLVLLGAGHFETACRSCHGSPGEPTPPVVRHMTPTPPELTERVKRYDAEELFYIVRHGIKFTGMPGWPDLERTDEIWAMVAFLQSFPELDAAGYRALVYGDLQIQPPPSSAMRRTTSQSVGHLADALCSRCHGSDGTGRGRGAFPKLAGQREAYLFNALEAFADGRRPSGVMEPVAAWLTQRERQELARYYASMPAMRSELASNQTAESAVDEGERLAHRGIPERKVPSCADCHGPSLTRAKPEYPILAGQYTAYLINQLELFQNGRRGGADYSHLMLHVVPGLTRSDINALAHYFASRPSPSPRNGVTE